MIHRLRADYQKWMPWLVVATILLGLAVDMWGGVWGQILVNVWVWALVTLLMFLVGPQERPTLFACLLLATTGEIVLSLVWGLYIYRLHNIPLFVPPGHVLLFWLGMHLTWRIPYALLRAIPPIAIVVIAGLALAGRDWLSVPLLGLFLICWYFGPSPRLYATMFVLSLLMEIYGTWMGNWKWQSQVPWLGWPTTNPPIAAGAFYCVLDLLVMLLIRRQATAQ